MCASSGRQDPVEGVEGAFVRARIVLKPALEQAGDGRFRAAHRAVQQDHAPLGTVVLGRAAEHADQTHEGDIEPEDGILAAVLRVFEEVEAH